MRMTSSRLVLLRLYVMTFGRLSVFSRLLRAFLLRLLVKGRKEKYVPSARFFSLDQIET